ncbi:ceramide phosphoethanolamine synthase [Drosophila teissieri]|uniref:ceramide phosphoethanolamine synthase n=1 Tax=Drosophila teissieri TaxID=7243 RepID=UPI001CB9FD41|nr:ceramide phosphoethanolamine synthase [Drosophila teissieri]XP_043644168.1 ceramide phosphoethanolamine synthase [Drosophila teissieri]
MIGPSSQISKILLTLLFLLIIFYVFMDVELYLRIHNYTIERNYHTNVSLPASVVGQSTSESGSGSISSSSSSSSIISTKLPTAGDRQPSYEDHTWISCDINPLCHVTVKAILLDHTNHYLFAPLATMFDNVIGFSRSTFITPNMISFFHVGVACLAGKLVASDSLGYRRLGVLLFQIRTFLDDLDGHVARVRKHIRGERSEIGTSGYYVDGLCDGLGCIALLLGIFFYLKNNPPRRGYSIIPMSDSKLPEPTMMIPKMKATTRKVAKNVISFTGQLLLSSTAWNRYIAVYQNMLEREDVSGNQSHCQDYVFKSSWFFCVAWMWRIVNVHALLHCVLLSIFCDKLWDFLRAIRYSGYIILLVAICLTEMHILEAQNYIFNSTACSNISL